MESLRDSVETSVSIKLFSSLKDASYAHIFQSELIMLPMSQTKQMENFNPKRLSTNPYPEDDRPRGQEDLDSVVYQRKLIRKVGQTGPIWVVLHKKTFTLLDGAHRIVATYLENKRNIPCHLIRL